MGDAQKAYENQKRHYIDLHNYEGELHSKLADLRGDTTKTMTNNKDLERIYQIDEQNGHRLKQQIGECDNEMNRL